MNIKELLLKNKEIVFINYELNSDENELMDNIASILSKKPKILVFNSNTNDKLTLNAAKKIQQLCSLFQSVLIIQKRLDIAKIINCDGILLNDTDIDLITAKNFLHNDMIILFSSKENIINSEADFTLYNGRIIWK